MEAQQPSVGRIVHYVSYGTPGGEYPSVCRAAIVTAVDPGTGAAGFDPENVDLCVLNPEGMFFNRHVRQDEGAGTPADPDCPNLHDGGPHRYCACGWTEPTKRGGTWHWPERV